MIKRDPLSISIICFVQLLYLIVRLRVVRTNHILRSRVVCPLGLLLIVADPAETTPVVDLATLDPVETILAAGLTTPVPAGTILVNPAVVITTVTIIVL